MSYARKFCDFILRDDGSQLPRNLICVLQETLEKSDLHDFFFLGFLEKFDMFFPLF